jgi:hypothetical protein
MVLDMAKYLPFALVHGRCVEGLAYTVVSTHGVFVVLVVGEPIPMHVQSKKC